MPEIHIWDINERRKLYHFVGIHFTEIYLLRFIKKGRFLLSCGKRENCTVVISDLTKDDSHITTTIDMFARNVICLTSRVGELITSGKQHRNHESTFFLFGRDRIVKNNCLHFDYRSPAVMIADSVNFDIGPMTSGLFVLVNNIKDEAAGLYRRRH